MAERPSPGSPEFEDLPSVTISYVFLPFFLWINNFHDVANKAGKMAVNKVAKKLSFGLPG